jgi:hypothetical protein
MEASTALWRRGVFTRRVALGAPLQGLDARAASAWLLALALIAYLGLSGGGYDPIVRSEVGILIWWAILLAALFAVTLPRLDRAAWVALALLGAFAVWTALSLSWTESTEKTVAEVARMFTYVGLFALVLGVQARVPVRHALNGLACGILVVAIVALLSRLHFQWFAAPATAQFLTASTRKLSYPLNYWNALGALMAMGIPALLYAACGARSILARAAAAGAVPLVALCAFLTDSRGGLIALGIGVVAFGLLVSDRVPKLAVMAASGLGSALLILSAEQRHAVRDGLRNATAAHQGNQMLAICGAVVVGVTLLAGAVALIDRHATRPPWMLPSRRRATALGVTGLVIAAVAFLAAGGPQWLSREWRQFKTPVATGNISQVNAVARLQNVSGGGRYQYWQAAARAESRHPLTGTGAGTFEYWWARDGDLSGGHVIDAHSLYMQAFGELGAVGLALIAAFVLFPLGYGVVASIRSTSPARRLAVATATAGIAAFAVSAAVDWIWFIAVLPAAVFVLIAVLLAGSTGQRERSTASDSTRRLVPRPVRGRLRRDAPRLGICLLALLSLAVIAVPMTAASAVRDSQSLALHGQLGPALARAREAARLQPYAATPQMQQALVLEQAGDITDALAPAGHATRLEPTNWRTWLLLSRLQARAGNAQAAVSAYERARALNRNSAIFLTQ